MTPKEKAKELLQKLVLTGTIAVTAVSSTFASNKSNTSSDQDDYVTAEQAAPTPATNSDVKTIAPFAEENVNAFNKRVDDHANSTSSTTTERNDTVQTVRRVVSGKTGDETPSRMRSGLLVPKYYKTSDDNKFHVGPISGNQLNAVLIEFNTQMNKLILEHASYRNIQMRQNNGENISLAERELLATHQQAMEKWGLKDKDGRLVQINPKRTQMAPYTEVKDTKALEKRIRQDIKDSGVVNKNGDLTMTIIAQQNSRP